MFAHTAKAKQSLEDAGYTFCKRAEDGWWQMMDDGIVIAVNRSMGDLVSLQGMALGVW